MRGSLLWGFPAAVTSVIRTADTRAFPMQVYVRFCPSYIQYDTVPYRTFGARAQLYTSVFCEQHQHSLAPTKLTQAFHQCHLYRGTMSHPVPVFRSVGTATMPAWEQLRGTHGHAPRPIENLKGTSQRTLRRAKTLLHLKRPEPSNLELLEATPNSDYPVGLLRPFAIASDTTQQTRSKGREGLQASTTAFSTTSTKLLTTMRAAISAVDVDAKWRQWGPSNNFVEDCILWGQLIDQFYPWPQRDDPPEITFPPLLQADPLARITYIDLAVSREQYLSIAFSITTMAWSNADSWRMARAKDCCLRDGKVEDKKKYESILNGLAIGDYLEWVETTTRIEDRPGLSRVGTADWTLFKVDSAGNRTIIGLGEGKPGTQAEHVEKLVGKWPMDGGTRPPGDLSQWKGTGFKGKITSQLTSQLIWTNTPCGFLLYDHFRRMALYKLEPQPREATSPVVDSSNLFQTTAHRNPSLFRLVFSPDSIATQHESSQPLLENLPTSYALQTVHNVSIKSGLTRAALAFWEVFKTKKEQARLFPDIPSDNLAKLVPPELWPRTRPHRRHREDEAQEELQTMAPPLPQAGPSVGTTPHGQDVIVGMVLTPSPSGGSAAGTGMTASTSGSSYAAVGQGSSIGPSGSASTGLNTSMSSVSLEVKTPVQVSQFQQRYEVEEEPFAHGASSAAHRLFAPPEAAHHHVLKVFRSAVQGRSLTELYTNECWMLSHLRDTGCVPVLKGTRPASSFPVSLTPKLVLEDAGLDLVSWMEEQADAGGITNGEPLHDRLWDAVVNAVAAMHSKGVIHGDLSWSNIRAVGDEPVIKIIDFDRATRSTDTLHRALDRCSAGEACTIAADVVFGEYWGTVEGFH